jgi:multidrug efflux system outer membrane protein
LSEPLFDGGRIRSNYRLSQAQQQEMVLEYKKSILNALKDVFELIGRLQGDP